MKKTVSLILCLFLLLLTACGAQMPVFSEEGERWTMGFGSCEIALPEEGPLYMAGYHGGREAEGVLDLQRANAVWLDTGGAGLLLIAVDCVALSSQTVTEIRQQLTDFCAETGCVSVNVSATHDHAGIDTLGLWGDTAMNGKNELFMANLREAAVTAARAAYADRHTGRLYYGSADTGDLQYDSRRPAEYDPLLHQFRFVPDGAEESGIRLLIYDAHAESLRGDNLLVSRDYPGKVYDLIKEETGDDTLFLPGAVGGLIMTDEQPKAKKGTAFDAVLNRDLTAQRLAETALSAADERELTPAIRFSALEFDLPLDNTLFMYYRFLGILGNELKTGSGETGYDLRTSLSILSLGDVTVAMLPGELFPELLSGSGLTAEDPEPLRMIAARYGIGELLVTGLCNDEIGYIVTPSDWMVHPELPYIEGVRDSTGENHYEETNSVGRQTAFCIAEAFEKTLALYTGGAGAAK